MHRTYTDKEIVEWAAQAKVGDAMPGNLKLHDVMAALDREGAPVVRGMKNDMETAQKLTKWARDQVERETSRSDP